MKSRHIRVTLISAYASSMPIADLGSVSESAPLADWVDTSLADEATVVKRLFKALINVALNSVEDTPLSKAMTILLGLSSGDEVIFSRQIGVNVGNDLHGLIVCTKPNSDDVILVNRTSELMYVYLTNSHRDLRVAATLERDSDQPNLVNNEHALYGFGRELYMWTVLAEIARL